MLLSGGAEGDQGGAEQALTDVAEASGPPRPGVLLVEDDLAAQRQPAAAVLGGPGDAGPAVGAEVALPREPLVEQGVLVTGPAPAPHLGELAAQAVLEEHPDLGAEGPVLRAVLQVHVPTISDTPSGQRAGASSPPATHSETL